MAVSGPTNNHEEIRGWAERQGVVPAELLPHLLDSVPALLQFMRMKEATARKDVKVLSWEEFFAKFDGLGLSFVYDEEDNGYNEILDEEEITVHGYSVDGRERHEH